MPSSRSTAPMPALSGAKALPPGQVQDRSAVSGRRHPTPPTHGRFGSSVRVAPRYTSRPPRDAPASSSAGAAPAAAAAAPDRTHRRQRRVLATPHAPSPRPYVCARPCTPPIPFPSVPPIRPHPPPPTPPQRPATPTLPSTPSHATHTPHAAGRIVARRRQPTHRSAHTRHALQADSLRRCDSETIVHLADLCTGPIVRRLAFAVYEDIPISGIVFACVCNRPDRV
jgi:hypothetical protein